ncbi:guanine deaminase [Acetobacteraceae bacterium H6797]|nr:guanine deaminase [Acetobacteraceae bacterium H6797]
MAKRWLRGNILDFSGDPFLSDRPDDCLTVLEDGMLAIEDGLIAWLGPAAEARPAPGEEVAHHPGALITPGLIDAHVHYPQSQMIGAFGEQLLEWLETYTFPTEAKFRDAAHSRRVAGLFLDELLRNGVTTACVYATSSVESVDAFFAEAESRGLRMAAGKVLMDRNAPAELLDGPGMGIEESRALIARWHGRGRLLYAVTPRFAPTSSPAQLKAAGRLWAEHPGTLMQTHLSENLAEIDWVRSLFPDRADYLDVYHQAGLTGRGAIFGHGVHLSEAEFCRCHQTGSALAHCPTSNLFLGSGLFPLHEAKRRDRPVCVALGSDIGAGTSLSPLRTMGEAYKVAALQGRRLPAAQAWWLATRGGAEAMGLEDRIGRIALGYEADLVVWDLAPNPFARQRMEAARNWPERLFVAMTQGEARPLEVLISRPAPGSA